jgi:sporulation protein YlmC with PRC-barrel domain
VVHQGIPMNATDIKGKAVISVTSGARLGRVDDVLFDAGSLAIAALRVSAEGQQALIPFDQVQSLGSDAVMVASADVAQWITTSSAAEGLISFDALKRYKVVDDAGTLLGTPQALELDPTNGRLQRLEIHKGGVLGMGGESATASGSDIASVGADVIVVRAATPSA